MQKILIFFLTQRVDIDKVRQKKIKKVKTDIYDQRHLNIIENLLLKYRTAEKYLKKTYFIHFIREFFIKNIYFSLRKYLNFRGKSEFLRT